VDHVRVDPLFYSIDAEEHLAAEHDGGRSVRTREEPFERALTEGKDAPELVLGDERGQFSSHVSYVCGERVR